MEKYLWTHQIDPKIKQTSKHPKPLYWTKQNIPLFQADKKISRTIFCKRRRWLFWELSDAKAWSALHIPVIRGKFIPQNLWVAFSMFQSNLFSGIQTIRQMCLKINLSLDWLLTSQCKLPSCVLWVQSQTSQCKLPSCVLWVQSQASQCKLPSCVLWVQSQTSQCKLPSCVLWVQCHSVAMCSV